MTLHAVSLFTNCGAGDLGYRRAGFTFDVLAELLPRRLDVAVLNHPRAHGVAGDLRETFPQVIDAWRSRRGDERPDLLAACPPCQGMSSARGGRGQGSDAAAGSRDPRNLLVQIIVDAAKTLRPRIIVVENVPAFLTRRVLHPRTQVPLSAAALLIEELPGYRPYPLVTNLAAHGVPQTRKRAFITLIDETEPAIDILAGHALIPFPKPTHADRPLTLGDALKAMRLPTLDAADPTTAADAERPMHSVPVWDEHRYRMIDAIEPGSGRSAWTNDVCLECGDPVDDEDAATCPSCGARLPRPVIEELGGRRLIIGFRRSSYSRMHPDQPAPTITTASGRIGSDHTIHPTQTRVLSPLECQFLQTIPDDFVWGDALATVGHTHVRAMIGEAVPPHFTAQHGRVLASLLNARRPYNFMTSDDPRHAKAVRTLQSVRDDASLEQATGSAVLARTR